MKFFVVISTGEFLHVNDAVKLHRPVAITFLGDLQAKRPLEVELREIICLTEVWFMHAGAFNLGLYNIGQHLQGH